MAKEVPKPHRKLFVAPIKHRPYSKSYKKKIWQDSERQLGMWLKLNCDPDRLFERAQTKCGRIGQITGLQMDAVSLEFCGENKSREFVPKWLEEALLLNLSKAKEWNKIPLFRLDIYGEISKDAKNNFVGVDRIPDLFLISVDDFEKLYLELKMCRQQAARNGDEEYIDDRLIGYLAGLLDGEGSIAIKKATHKDHKNPSYGLRVLIFNTDIQLMQFLKDKLGGLLFQKNKKRVEQGMKPLYAWMLNGNKAIEFLDLVEDSLIIKKERAEVARKFQRRISDREKVFHNRLSEEEVQAREILYLEMKELNRRGNFKEITA